MCQSNRPHILTVVANILWRSDGFSLVLCHFSGEGEKQVFFLKKSKVYKSENPKRETADKTTENKMKGTQ